MDQTSPDTATTRYSYTVLAVSPLSLYDVTEPGTEPISIPSRRIR